MRNNFIIYKITNCVNSKVYIGITTRTINRRFKDHILDSKNPRTKFHKAIKKIGIENFQVEEICRCSNKSTLKTLEIFFIRKFDSYRKGYNSTVGGDGAEGVWLGREHKKSTKIKMSKKMKGNSNGSFRTNFVKVDLIDDNDDVIRTYDSVLEAANDLGIKCPSDISRYCRGLKKSFNSGYRFRYNGGKYKSKRDE